MSDANCAYCSEPILKGKGRQRRIGGDYHDDAESNCYEESLKDAKKEQEIIDRVAEKMSRLPVFTDPKPSVFFNDKGE